MALLGVALLALASCAAAGGRGGHQSQPPPDLRPQRVLLGLIGSVADTDDNGFPDTIGVMIFIYGNHEVPFTPPGAFTFRLLTEDDQEVVRWDISSEQAQRAVSNRNLAGPAFTFRLDIRDHLPTDKMKPVSLGLTATFTPTDGEPINAAGRRHVQFGHQDR
jgi:hypothetical protein